MTTDVADAVGVLVKPTLSLTLADRCDATANRTEAAVVAVWLGEGAEPLLFCGHHYAEHEARLIAAAWHIHDQRTEPENRQQGEA